MSDISTVLYCTAPYYTVLHCTDLLGVCEVWQGVEGEGAEDGEQGEQAAGRQHRPGVAGQQPHVPAVTLYYGSKHDKHHCHRIIIIVMYFFQ